MAHNPVIIIGAGPAGLTAAYELSKLGLQARLLEADSQVGGLSRTVNYQGYRFDIGGHRFFSKVPLINEVWQEILGADLLCRPRLSRIHYAEHFFDYPLKALDAFVGLGPVEALLISFSYAKAQLWPHPEETTFEQWVSNRFGQRLYEIFFKTYTEKVWGIPCAEISADWAAQRIKNLSLGEAVRNALFGARQSKDGQVITTLIDEFQYPRLGPGMMWEECEKRLARQGSETVYGVQVERIGHRQGRVEYLAGQTAAGESLECSVDSCISTMPLRDLIRALDPAPPATVLAAAEGLRYRDYLTVALIVEQESVFPDNWLYIHSPEVRMGRIQNYKNWSPEMVPEPSQTSLGLEYFLWDHDEEWDWPDERLLELGIRECAQIGIIDPKDVVDGTVVRMRKAYPVYDQHYQDSVATVRRYLETLSNLQTIGRNGLHRYNNQDHSMLTGIYAARNIAGHLYDVWSVNTETEYLEEGGTHGDRMMPSRITVAGLQTARDERDAIDEVMQYAFAKLDSVALGVALGSVCGIGLVHRHCDLAPQGRGCGWPNIVPDGALLARISGNMARCIARFVGSWRSWISDWSRGRLALECKYERLRSIGEATS